MMYHTPIRALVAAWLCLALLASATRTDGSHAAAHVEVACDDTTTTIFGNPFPSDRLTTKQEDNLTGKRVNLPLPDCTILPSDCEEIALVNTLDGFSRNPRIILPFTGPIDVSTATSDTIFLLNLGDVTSGHGLGQRVGINQRLWDPNTTALIFKPDEVLDEHTEYALIATTGLLDTTGRPVRRRAECDVNIKMCDAVKRSFSDDSVCQKLRSSNYAVVSTFTTLSSSAEMFKILDMIKDSTPKPIDFIIGSTEAGRIRAVFPIDSISSFRFLRQRNVSSKLDPQDVTFLNFVKAAKSVGDVAYGEFSSPQFLNNKQFIPSTPTGSGNPEALGDRKLLLQIFLPAGEAPADGWPVVIVGHGITDSLFGSPWALAPSLASAGMAIFAINAVGHGWGPDGQIVISKADNVSVTFGAGGRGLDTNGDGLIDSMEGLQALPPYYIAAYRDGVRQTAIDLLQLLQLVRNGVDIDGDGYPDFNVNRVYYGGYSLGSLYGTIVMGVDHSIRAGVLNVPGGSNSDIARLGVFRRLLGASLGDREPPLLNGRNGSIEFNENIPLRNLPVVINDVPGALAIAAYVDRWDWAGQSGSALSYVSFIRRSPPLGGVAKLVLAQGAKGDQTIPNPTFTAFLRAGSLQDRATFFRADLRPNGAITVGHDPHNFLIGGNDPVSAPIAFLARKQFATFLGTDGLKTIDPDGRGPLFEVPIALPLPEGLNFLSG